MCLQFQVWFILCYATIIGLISAEISSPDEVQKILGFHPDHVCHCTCIHPLHLYTRIHDKSQELQSKPTLPNSCIRVGKYRVVWQHFSKEKKLLNTKCVFWFSLLHSYETFLIPHHWHMLWYQCRTFAPSSSKHPLLYPACNRHSVPPDNKFSVSLFMYHGYQVMSLIDRNI
jgi:hypothetical protein